MFLLGNLKKIPKALQFCSAWWENKQTLMPNTHRLRQTKINDDNLANDRVSFPYVRYELLDALKDLLLDDGGAQTTQSGPAAPAALAQYSWENSRHATGVVLHGNVRHHQHLVHCAGQLEDIIHPILLCKFLVGVRSAVRILALNVLTMSVWGVGVGGHDIVHRTHSSNCTQVEPPRTRMGYCTSWPSCSIHIPPCHPQRRTGQILRNLLSAGRAQSTSHLYTSTLQCNHPLCPHAFHAHSPSVRVRHFLYRIPLEFAGTLRCDMICVSFMLRVHQTKFFVMNCEKFVAYECI